jgi:hypothetical protein
VKVKLLTSDGVELSSDILDVLVWQREFSKDLSYASSFIEVAALFFKTDIFYCEEGSGGIECRWRNVKLRIKRGNEDEVVITVEMTLSELMSFIMYELFEKVYWLQNDVRDLSKAAHDFKKQVERLRKVVKRLLWLRVR